MNKSVKATRSLKRNRQQHEVTSAYVELKNWYRMSDSHKRPKVEQPYIMCIRDNIEKARFERNEILAAEQLKRDAIVLVEEHSDDEDDLYDQYNEDYDARAEAIEALLLLA